MKDLIEKFDLNRLNPAPAAINLTKFDHFNGVHIRQLTTSDLAQRIKPFFIRNGYMVNDHTLKKIAPIIQERIAGLDEALKLQDLFLENVNPAIEDQRKI
jgi:glutamyl-tRNA synthetase